MKRFCLYPHPSSLNHGCEAIAVSTCAIMNKYMPSVQKTLLTKFDYTSPQSGSNLAYGLFDEVYYCPLLGLNRWSKNWFSYQAHKLMGKDVSISLLTGDFLKRYGDILNRHDIFVAIGGDNYCYGTPTSQYATHQAIYTMGKKSILWGCSIEPSAITPEMVEDLKKYDVICARESLTYQALKDHHLNNIKLFPDPAFTLVAAHRAKTLNNAVGINLSPLVLNYAADPELPFHAYKRMIQYILNYTDCNIALIPHVVESTTDDRVVLKRLYDEIKDKERLIIFDDMDCQEVKAVISQCRFFIGARTHATIAAYSSCVPTLVCGYSVKAKGIATDLFGTYANYVVPAQGIEDDTLEKAFMWMLEHEDQIRGHLNKIMPAYIQRAWDAGSVFRDVLD